MRPRPAIASARNRTTRRRVAIRMPVATAPDRSGSKRAVSNFAALSVAEVVCRAISMAVTLLLASRLGREGNGKIAFAFNVVFWLVLLVRDGLEVIAAREIARHPRLIRPLVDHLLAIKGVIALTLFGGLVLVGSFTLKGPGERTILAIYGLMLLTTALGLDYVYRGTERMGLVAVSLVLRTAIYASGVVACVTDASRIVLVPVFLVVGEACGIALVWADYARHHGMPRPAIGSRFARVVVGRGRPVYVIQIAQAVLGSVDILVIGLMSRWGDVGLYDAPHRMSMAVLTFGLIFQQVVLPGLARSWRDTPESGREALNHLVRVLMIGLIPMAVGATILSRAIVHGLLHAEYKGAEVLLAVGIWRAPLLAVAFLYQTALIALNREKTGVRLLIVGAAASVPLVALANGRFGLVGASSAVLAVGLSLVGAGYLGLWRERRQPAWHHHLGRPLLASLAMIPAAGFFQRYGLACAIASGAAAYLLALWALGGLNPEDLRLLCRHRPGEASSRVHDRA